jgi:hypothetical protein
MSNTMKIVRRNPSIQKDFFSMMEYLIWAVHQHFELDYYKRKSKGRKAGSKRQLVFID